ncbi:hypothetical protein AB0H71_29835 [Nocardia sp. NPDC050697]|uniref:hypothetical protein n=1 Tax=Nocardia sp. NPDC050697 TaxID=3155158 RepID=UPI0033CE7B52
MLGLKTRARLFGVAVSGVAAAVVLAAPGATADITNGKVTVAGNTHIVGQTYAVSATALIPGTSVRFIDRKTGSNTDFTEIGIATADPNLVATINWTPTATGSRTVIAQQLNLSGGVYSTIGWVQVPVS